MSNFLAAKSSARLKIKRTHRFNKRQDIILRINSGRGTRRIRSVLSFWLYKKKGSLLPAGQNKILETKLTLRSHRTTIFFFFFTFPSSNYWIIYRSKFTILVPRTRTVLTSVYTVLLPTNLYGSVVYLNNSRNSSLSIHIIRAEQFFPLKGKNGRLCLQDTALFWISTSRRDLLSKQSGIVLCAPA